MAKSSYHLAKIISRMAAKALAASVAYLYRRRHLQWQPSRKLSSATGSKIVAASMPSAESALMASNQLA
jgi:hypothetical protein